MSCQAAYQLKTGLLPVTWRGKLSKEKRIWNQGILEGLFSQNDGDMNAAANVEGATGRQIPNV